MYQPYPGGADPREPSPANAPPQSVRRAVKFMYAGLAASLIGIIVSLTTLSSARSAIIANNPGLTTTQVNDSVHVLIGLAVAGGLIGGALWLWMAQKCQAGKAWARVTSTVFFGIDTLGLLVSSAGSAGHLTESGVSRVYGIVVWLIGLAAISLLWRRSSSGYFRGAPRY